MVGETTADHQPAQNIFCIWRGGQPADFELKLQYKLTGATRATAGSNIAAWSFPMSRSGS